MKRKTKKDYHKLAESRGFKWIGGVLPKNVRVKSWWECEKCGYGWQARYNNINNGQGCPFCAGTLKKVQKDYHSLANSCGFIWVGDVLPKNIQTKTWWECVKCGYKWEARYSTIWWGHGCSFCAGNVKKTQKDYHNLAKTYGFRWVGIELPKNVHIISLWECSAGHRWEVKYNDIQQGKGCPQCQDIVNGALVSKPQRKLNDSLCGILNYPEGRYRIDVAIMRNSQKLAVEYDAHYWHRDNEAHEIKRDKYLINKGWKILHVRAGVLLPTRKQLTTSIRHLLNTDDKIYNLYLEDWK